MTSHTRTYDSCDRREKAGWRAILQVGHRTGAREQQFDALLNPVVRSHRLPVLAAHHIHQPVVDSLPHRAVKDLTEFGSNVGLSAAETSQEGGLQLAC